MTVTDAELQVKKLTQSENELVSRVAEIMLDPNTTASDMVLHWHDLMNIRTPSVPQKLAPHDMVRRLRLLLSEVEETVHAAGYRLVDDHNNQPLMGNLSVEKVEGAEQDLVEVFDGLQDVAVVCIGHGHEHGFPMHQGFREVMLSNTTKIPSDGFPLVNKCVINHECNNDTDECQLIDPKAPAGKILKPSTYVKADLRKILVDAGFEG